MPRWLSPAQVAAEFNLSRPVLQALRAAGTGCAFSKIGHKTIRYLHTDMEAWMRSYAEAPQRGAAAPLHAAITAAATRLGTFQSAAESLAMQTPSDAAIPGAKALAADLGREVDELRTMAGEMGAA